MYITAAPNQPACLTAPAPTTQAPPSLHLPPSLPLSVSSLPAPSLRLPAFFPHFLIFATQALIWDLSRNTFSLHPSSLLQLHIPCCTRDQLIYSSHFVFLRFVPLVVVGANSVAFFFCFFLFFVLVELIQVFTPLLFVCLLLVVLQVVEVVAL
jgi:hypothetical protein